MSEEFSSKKVKRIYYDNGYVLKVKKDKSSESVELQIEINGFNLDQIYLKDRDAVEFLAGLLNHLLDLGSTGTNKASVGCSAGGGGRP